MSIALALLLCGVAGAANTFTFVDASGDADSAPDITTVSVVYSDSGTLMVSVTLANRPGPLRSDDELGVNLDLDQNPDTGSVLYGSEVAMVFEGATLEFLRPDSKNLFMAQATAPPSLQGSVANGVATFSIKPADLGLSPTGGFNVFALADNDAATDTAPEIRTVNYQLVPGTAPPTLGPDRRPPFDRAFPARGRRGKVVHLDYQALDGRAVTADTVRVYSKGRVVKTFAFRLDDSDAFTFYYASWHAPKRIRAPLKFCVNSRDAAGNKSNTACAGIVLR
jgi:hypothetical protein